MAPPDVEAARARGFTVVDTDARSWVDVPTGSDFPLQNLPYGVFSVRGGPRRIGVAIGDHVLDLAAVAAAGLLDDVERAREVCAHPSLNALLAAGRPTWAALRRRLATLLRAGSRELADAGIDALHPRDAVTLHLPFEAGDFVDFYSSLEHATNVGRILRPDSAPLLPNWRHLPVAYHGRSSTIVVSGTPVRRPRGQTRPGADGKPGFGPSTRLDFELEVGFVTGPGNPIGTAIPADEVARHVFGLVLVNDWSARDLQAWEYQPLGPFLGKSFATTVSPWVVPLDAVAPWFVPQPRQEPTVLDYLQTSQPWGLDLQLDVAIAPDDGPETTVTRTGFAHTYWTMAQQLAHLTVNGAAVRPGDLYASGTVSGPERGAEGSLLELSWGGERPVALAAGHTRTFLEDGDTVTLHGWCEGGDHPRIGFGSADGRVLAAEG